MASPAMLAPQQTAAPLAKKQPDQQERSASKPQALAPADIKSNFGLTQDMEQTLIQNWRLHTEMWAEERDQRIRRALRAIEYDHGNQYISWDPSSGGYISPFSDVTAGSVFDQQGGDKVYHKVTNLCQWARKITVATLTRQLPHVEFWPADSESDEDNRTSKAKSQAALKIGRDNGDEELLELGSEYLFNTGSFFRHIYWSMDARLTGTQMQPEIGWQDRNVLPSRYSCPDCGMDNPAPPIAQGQEPPPVNCLSCYRKLGSAYFHAGVSMKTPVVTGQREVPLGMVRQDLWNMLNVDTMPNIDTSKGSPIMRLPMLDLQCEITRGGFRTMYPGAWDEIQNAQPEGGALDSGVARDARFRASSPSMMTNMAMSDRMPTYHRLWITEEFCRMADDRDKGEQLAELITQDGRVSGACAVIVNDKIIDIQRSDLTKSFTWCGTKRGAGTFPPALVEPGLDIQDRYNDRSNSMDEYYDRMGCPPILFDETMIASGLSNQFLPPGTLKGVPANRDMGRSLKDAFFQPDFHQDNGVGTWIEQSLVIFQLLLGCQPQTYGGSDPNIQTAQGQQQALGTATTILMLTLKQMRRENADASELSVDCLIANAQADIKSVTKSDDAVDFKTETIALADLSVGTAEAYPEASEGYPVDFDDQRALYKELLVAAKDNPIIQEVLDSYEAQRLAMAYLGPPGLELPQKVPRDKVLRDIGMLTKGTARQAIDPDTQQPIMIPSVMPDKDVDGPTLDSVSIPLVIRYLLKNYQLAQTNPPVFENLKAYLRVCKQFSVQQKMQLPPPPAPGGAPQLPPGPPQGQQ